MTLLSDLRARMRAEGTVERAAGAQAYLKSAMPCWGVTNPQMRAICKELYAGRAFTSRAAWERDVLSIWKGATHREERMCAIALTGVRAARPFQTMDALPLYERLIREGAWWDLVDEIATHRLVLLFDDDARAMKKAMLAWSKADDLWIRRSAIICQVTRKERTDLDLLYRAIEANAARKEFFLRKAIGWALRSYAWHDPKEVLRYVRAHAGELSPLSKREALKNVLKSGLAREVP